MSGKDLRQSHFLNKVAGLRLMILLKKRLWHRCFPVNFGKFSRKPFFMEHLRWLLLNLELAEVQTGQTFDRYFWEDKLISKYLENKF